MKTWAVVYKLNMVKNTEDTEKCETRTFSGKIKKIDIHFPAGNNFSAGVRFEYDGVEDGSDDAAPKKDNDAETYFVGNDNVIPLTPDVEIIQGKIRIFGANGDAVNDHEIVLTVQVQEMMNGCCD